MSLIIILVVILLIVITIQNKEEEVDKNMDFILDNSSFEDDIGIYYIKYENGVLEYSAKVTKPTPCHKVDIKEFIMESYPVQVEVSIEVLPDDSGMACVQVIDEETVEGTLEIGHKPGSFAIKLNGGRVYSTDLKQSCKGMNLEEAKQIAVTECGELKDNAFCNEGTNTWWIDLNVEKEGCAPACVVNVLDKSAEINWRCTGLIPQ